MAVMERTYGQPNNVKIDEVLISADSHVIEPEGLWKKKLQATFGDRAPPFGGRRDRDSPGAMEGTKRVSEMVVDGVSAEVLFPTHGARILSMEDADLSEACARVYNDWLIDYCKPAPDRMFGLALLSMYNVEHAVTEMERCRKAGMRGALIWQVPPAELPFSSNHYDRFWAAAQDMNMPVNLHILTGFGYSKRPADSEVRAYVNEKNGVNGKLIQAMDALYDLIFSGVLERFPRLRVVLAENEIGWLPFLLEQWDYYYQRFNRSTMAIKKRPSEYFHEQVYATFFNDAVGGHTLSWWGVENCMWSSDYPHSNSAWPHSRDIVARDLGTLPKETRAKVVRENVARLYDIKIPTPAAAR